MSISKPKIENIGLKIPRIDKKTARVLLMCDDENVLVSQIQAKIANIQEMKRGS